MLQLSFVLEHYSFSNGLDFLLYLMYLQELKYNILDESLKYKNLSEHPPVACISHPT